MPAKASKPYPWYYAVNDRPVKFVEMPDGGLDALVFDWATGGFVPDRSYFGLVSQPFKDVEELSKHEFDLRVGLLRVPISDKRYSTPIVWEHTGDSETPYTTKVGERVLTIRLNDFPAEPMYSLLVDGEVVEFLDDWPPAWVKPPMPQALLDMLARTKKP